MSIYDPCPMSDFEKKIHTFLTKFLYSGENGKTIHITQIHLKNMEVSPQQMYSLLGQIAGRCANTDLRTEAILLLVESNEHMAQSLRKFKSALNNL